MRFAVLLAIAIVVGFTTDVRAASADLVFCSQRSDKAERLACYDAAARIAQSKPTRSALVGSAKPVATAAPERDGAMASGSAAQSAHYAAAVSPNAFAGWYGAIGGSYATSSTHIARVNGLLFGTERSVQPDGASAVAAAGYNIAHGPWIWGIEADARWGNEETGFRRSIVVPGFFTGFGDLLSDHRYRYKNDIAVHLSLRGGMTFADTMVFAKVGGGVTRLVQNFDLVETPLQLDAAPFVQSAKTTTWVPSYLFGVGIERNVGWAFVRLSGEVEVMNPQWVDGIGPSGGFVGFAGSNEPLWTARANGMVGARF